MCHEASGATYDRPLFRDDMPLIARHFPNIEPDAVAAIFDAITDHHWPQPAVLVTVLELLDRHQRGDTGLYAHPIMPFSAMDIDTYERVQTAAMREFHTVFESMALAQRNMDLLNKVLEQRFGVLLILFCDCGCGLITTDENAFESAWYKAINDLRSLAESVGTPVVRVSSFEDPEWRERLLDMGPSETSSYERMFSILQSLPSRDSNIAELASRRFKELFTAQA
jgi:hypothetical protein